MAQHLENTDKFFWTRKSRFPDQFLGDIRAMVNSTVYEITTKLEVGTLDTCRYSDYPQLVYTTQVNSTFRAR